MANTHTDIFLNSVETESIGPPLNEIRIDKNTGEATILKFQSPLFVAAQEITSTAETNKWIEQQRLSCAFLRLDTIGFSV